MKITPFSTPVDSVVYSCHHRGARTTAAAVPEHYLTYIRRGTLAVHIGGKETILTEGTTGIIRRHTLARFQKHLPQTGGPFESVSVALHQDRIRQWLSEREIPPAPPYQGERLNCYLADTDLQKIINALGGASPNERARPLSTNLLDRLLESLIAQDSDLHAFLFDLSPLHKIDLVDFMGRNFSYNVPLQEFSRLSGRSLSTFKRDFRKYFSLPPERWLLNKRLETAHHLIETTNSRPTDAAYEVGFRNVSHFSTAFKNKFGYTAAALRVQQLE